MLTISIPASPASPTAAAGATHSQEPPLPAPLGSGVNGGPAGRVERAAHRTGVEAALVERLPFDL